MPIVDGMEAKVYMSFKLSYDSLEGNSIKSCFLYCSLFSEDFSIELSELVQCWLAEGLIDEQQNFVDSINRGVDLIERLKDSCLLGDGVEEGTVKMHDFVRDVAIWISESSEDGCKSLVHSGSKLSEISVQDLSKLNSNSHQRVSFMDNEITRLPDSVIQCSEASSLLLQHNLALEKVPARFLQGFIALRLLNLGNTRIQSLPPSLLQLGDLRALLRNCSSLGELPSLGGFSTLQMLNLGGTGIRELPRGLENLCNLKLLDLSDTENLKTIQAGIISRLSCLENLQLKNSAYHFYFNGEEKRGDTTFKSIPCLSSEDVSWIKRLRAFQIFIGQPPLHFRPRITTTNEKIVIIGEVDFPQESIEELRCIAKSLVLDNCRGLNEMVKDLAINIGGCFDGLSSLAITGDNMSLRPTGRWAASCDLLPNLEELIIKGLNELESILELAGYLGLRFLRLKIIEVRGCSDIKYLFSHGDFFRALPNRKVSGGLGEVQKFLLPKLEEIKVSGCQNLDKLFNYDSGQNMAPYPVVPMLRILELEKLCNLRTLGRQEETWPRLEKVEVIGCNRLERLPLTEQNKGTIREIKGESEWWNALKWNDDETKSSMPYFSSI